MLALQAVRLALSGPSYPPDIVGFEQWADALIAAGFDPAEFLSGVEFKVPPVLYLAWVALVALAKLCFGGAWPWALAGLNCLAVAWMVFLTGRLVWGITASGLACLAACLLPFACFDFWLWPRYLLADTIFACLCLALMSLALGSVAGAVPRPRLLLPGLFLGGIMLVFRPTAAPALLWFFAAPAARLFAGWRNAIRAGFLIPVLLGLAACTLLAAAWLVPNLGRLGLASPGGWAAAVEQRFNQGVVVRDRPDTSHAPYRCYADALSLTLDKFYHYFVFWRPEFSPAHKALNLGFFVPAYVLAFLALIPLPGGRRVSLAAVLVLAWIIIFAVFQAVQYIDYDWRYRLPVLAPLMVLAGLGAGRLWPKSRRGLP